MGLFEDYALPIISRLPRSEVETRLKDEGTNSIPIWIRIMELDPQVEVIEINVPEPPKRPPRRVGIQDEVEDAHVFEKPTQREIPFIPELNDEWREAIDGGIYADGFETLAFYKSLHFLEDAPFSGKWGIFLFDFGIASIAEEIEMYYPDKWSHGQRINKAIRFLHRHERFHFHFDAWAISHEAIQLRPLYEDYINGVYRSNYPSIEVVEESLANRHAYYSMRREGITEFMSDFMERQPPAYNNFLGDVGRLRSILAGSLLDGSTTHHRKDQEPWVAPRNYIVDNANCPVHIIRKCPPAKIIPLTIGAPSMKENKLFIENYLNGQFLSRTDHDFYRIDNGEKLKVPNSHGGQDRLKPWEFKGTVCKAGMTPSEFKIERSRTRTWKKHVPRKIPKPPFAE